MGLVEKKVSPKSWKLHLDHKKLGPVKKHLLYRKVNLILIFNRKRALIIKKCSILTLKKHEIKKFDRSSKTPTKTFKTTKPPHYNHSTPLNRLKIKDLDFALDLLKILLNEHFKSDTIALLLKITYFSFHLSKTTAPLPSNHQQNHLIS